VNLPETFRRDQQINGLGESAIAMGEMGQTIACRVSNSQFVQSAPSPCEAHPERRFSPQKNRLASVNAHLGPS